MARPNSRVPPYHLPQVRALGCLPTEAERVARAGPKYARRLRRPFPLVEARRKNLQGDGALSILERDDMIRSGE